ncbi:unnamed protein product [Caenorhabditis brenneri]
MLEMLVDQTADASSSASTSTSSVVSSSNRFGGGADAFLNTPDDVMMNDDLEPIPRDRCNTWPMRRPQLEPPLNGSPMIHDQIPEEDPDLFGSSEQCGRLGGPSTNGSTAMLHSPDGNSSHPNAFGNEMSESPDDAASQNSKKATTRRNAWGNMSYAELITTAIMASPEKRLTLAQVYEWMVQNVPYFRDKGDSNSSAGWKKESTREGTETLDGTGKQTGAGATAPHDSGGPGGDRRREFRFSKWNSLPQAACTQGTTTRNEEAPGATRAQG